jgi:hypothetical protein|nr:MAG TPA: Protein of unknown function (DUF1043) [Caudoviricetes sp.]
MSGEALAGGFEAAAIAEPLAALLAFTVAAVCFVVVKWGMPQRRALKEKQLENERAIEEKKLEIERYRIEVQETADKALDSRERERIKTTQQQVAAQNEQTRVIETLSNGQQAQTRILEVLSTQVGDSKERSHEMGGRLEHTEATAQRIDQTTSHMAKQIDEVHAIVVRRKGAGDEG